MISSSLIQRVSTWGRFDKGLLIGVLSVTWAGLGSGTKISITGEASFCTDAVLLATISLAVSPEEWSQSVSLIVSMPLVSGMTMSSSLASFPESGCAVLPLLEPPPRLARLDDRENMTGLSGEEMQSDCINHSDDSDEEEARQCPLSCCDWPTGPE